MASKLEKAVADARQKFEATGSADDELALIRLEKQLLEEKLASSPNASNDFEAEKAKAIADAVASAVSNAVKQSNSPRHREVKQHLDKLITCDEVIVEKSEKNGNGLVVVETLRTGIAVTQDQIEVYNQSILSAVRAKILVPQKDKKAFLNNMGK